MTRTVGLVVTLGVLGLATAVTTPLAAQEPVRVGVLTIRSGPIASCGRQMEDGLQFALKERGGVIAGRKIEVFFGDSAGQPAQTRARTDASAVIGPSNDIVGDEPFTGALSEMSIAEPRPRLRASRSRPTTW